MDSTAFYIEKIQINAYSPGQKTKTKKNYNVLKDATIDYLLHTQRQKKKDIGAESFSVS